MWKENDWVVVTTGVVSLVCLLAVSLAGALEAAGTLRRLDSSVIPVTGWVSHDGMLSPGEQIWGCCRLSCPVPCLQGLTLLHKGEGTSGTDVVTSSC